jgi:PAS domain S-box-containing protein
MDFISTRAQELTGYPVKDLLAEGTGWFDIIHPDDRVKYVQSFEHCEQTGRVIELEYRVCRHDGNIRWVRDTIIPHRDENNKFCKFDGLVEDITERKEIAQALQQSQARYQRMVANVPGLVYQIVLRTDGSVSFPFVSDSCAELFGVEPEKVKADGNLLLDKIDPEDRAEFYHLMAESAEKLSPCDWWGKMTTGDEERLFHSVSRPERLQNGDTQWDGLILEKTDLRKTEEQIRTLAKFPAENPNPVMRISADGVIIFANNASAPLLDLWSKKVDESLPENMQTLVSKVRASGSHNCIEVQCKDHIFSIVFAPVPDSDYVNIYARDITEGKKTEMKLIKANEILKEHDRLKSEFVSTVSHELRTPLCIFKNIVSNAMAGVMGKVSSKLYESLKMADSSVDRLSRIVADFLDISKIEAGTMRLDTVVLDVQSVVSEVAESLRTLSSEKGIELKTNMPKAKIFINADRDRIIQVLTNLIGNSIKFIPVNGNINVFVTDHDDEVEIAVQDDGPGLSRDEMDRIFDRFVQIHNFKGAGEHGTGLGLTISKELVDMHKGRIWVESAPAEGCCFHVMLPKYKPDGSDNADNNKSLKNANRKKNQDLHF